MNERIEKLLEQVKVNDKIQELAEQAGCKIDRLGYGEGNLEKFAELLIRECAQVAHNKQYKHSPAHTVGDCATAIKEHFGVE